MLAGRYFTEGADEVTFLNITGFRDFPLGDLPMLEARQNKAFQFVLLPLPFSLLFEAPSGDPLVLQSGAAQGAPLC